MVPNPSLSPAGADMENRLLDVLRQEAAACASLLVSAREIQRALLAADSQEVERASQRQLKMLATLHRIELARRALLVAWADRHGMMASTVTVADVANRMDSDLGKELMRQARVVADRLAELYLVNQCNKSVVNVELGLRRALWQYLVGEETALVYGPRGPGGGRKGGRLVERQA